MVRARLSDRLLTRIRADLPEVPVPERASIRRVHASLSARSNGSWLWTVVDDATGFDTTIGGHFTVGETLAAPVLVADCTTSYTPHDWHVTPRDWPQR